jgi:parvulin-like peptidyl-prolyl isomerase
LLKTIILILSLVYLNSGYSQSLFFENDENSKIINDIVAIVGDSKITVEEFIYSYEYGPAFAKRTENSKMTHLKYMINEKLLAIDGFQTGIIDSVRADEVYGDIESDLAAEEMFKKEIADKIEIKEDEVEKVIKKKLLEYHLRWLYVSDENKLNDYIRTVKEVNTFDSLFSEQLNDSVDINDRQLKSSLFSIYMKNPLFARIIDTLKTGIVSDPIHTDDGWYIVRIDNILENLITSETEYTKLRSESVNAITKSKMDQLSDQYVRQLFSEEDPVIKRSGFNVLRSYLGKFILTKEKYSEWDLDNKLTTALNNLGLKKEDKYAGLTLVECKNLHIPIEDFLVWYKNREQYLKTDKNDLTAYSKSLEEMVWLMVRDKLLADRAYRKGYNKADWVIKQAGWWKDKITYSLYRNALENSVTLDVKEQHLKTDDDKSKSEIMDEELTKKLLRKVLQLKQKHKISINEDILKKVQVSSENDKRAIEMFIVKRGNLIPRPAYPTIDNDWAGWE